MLATPAPILKPITLAQVRYQAGVGLSSSLKKYNGKYKLIKCVTQSNRYGLCSFNVVLDQNNKTYSCNGLEQVRNIGSGWEHRYLVSKCTIVK